MLACDMISHQSNIFLYSTYVLHYTPRNTLGTENFFALMSYIDSNHKMSPQLNIVIIGAGIAGLTTAIALCRSGHTITILERHSGCQALGGRVGISPSGPRILIAHGLGDVLRKMNVRENVTNFRRYENGAILTSNGTQNMEDVYGSP
jgi:hypothetical protein